MRAFIAAKKLNILEGNEAGLTLIEVLVALALLGIIAVAFLGGLTTAFKAVAVSQDKVVAESLANSQLEYIKVQDYIAVADYDPGDPEKCYQLVNIPADLVDKGYEIEISPPEAITAPSGGDDLQSVTVVVKRNGEEMLTISDYKLGGLT